MVVPHLLLTYIEVVVMGRLHLLPIKYVFPKSQLSLWSGKCLDWHLWCSFNYPSSEIDVLTL